MALRSTPSNIITSSGGTVTGNTTFPNGINVYSEAVASNAANDDVRYYKLARVRFATTFGRSLFNIKVYHTGTFLKIGNIKGYFYNGATKRSVHSTSFLMVINNSGSTGFSAGDLSYVPLDSGSDTNDYIVDVYMKIANFARIYENTESATFENSSTLTIKPDASTVIVSLPTTGSTTTIDGIVYTYGTFVSGVITNDLNSMTATVDNTIPRFDGTAGQLKTSGVSINAANQVVSPIGTGTAPFLVSSTTEVANLNASRVNSKSYTDITNYVGASGTGNLLKNSSWLRDITGWALQTPWARDTVNIMDKTTCSATISRTGLGSDSISVINNTLSATYLTPAKVGDIFTVSGWFFSPDIAALDGSKFGIAVKTINSSIAEAGSALFQSSLAPTVSNVWQKFSYTFTVTDPATVYLMMNPRVYRNGTISITNLQLERGNYATDWKPSVSDIVDGSYTASGSMLQTTKVCSLSAITLSGTQTIDSVAVVVGDRVLVVAQASSVDNGIYIVASGAWSRSNDTLIANTIVTIEKGTIWADTVFLLSSDSPITVGTSSLAFTRVGRPMSSLSTVYTTVLRDANGDAQARVLKSDAPQGTAPLSVVSTTVVPNLNASQLNSYADTAFVKVTPNNKITDEGGIAIRMLNKTGVNSVKGSCVQISDTTDNGFRLTVTSGFTAMGFVYESGIADGSLCWVVVTGIAEALVEDSVATTRGDILIPSGTVAGRVMPQTLPTTAQHFQEVGHPIESKSAGTNVLAKITIHFN